MQNIKISKKWSNRITGCVIAGLLALTFVFGLCVLQNNTMTALAKDDEGPSWSMYDVAKAVSQYMSKSLEPGSDISLDINGLNAGQAGVFVGFDDSDGFLASLSSKSSTSWSYAAFETITNTTTGTSAAKYPILDYCRYGYLLTTTGLDSTSGDSAFGALILGWIMWFVFTVCNLVPKVMSWVIDDVLIPFNPFQFFTIADVTTGHVMVDNVTATTRYTMMSNFVSEYVHAFRFIGLILIGFLAVISILLMLLSKKKRGDGFSTLKKFVLRLTFIAIGLPLFATLYTGLLTSTSGMVASGNSPALSVVASTFVDFEGWVVKSRLAVPSGAVIEYASDNKSEIGAAPSKDMLINLRSTAYKINQAAYQYSVLFGANDMFSDGYDTSNSWNTSATTGTSSNATYAYIVSLIERYRDNDHFFASDYEMQLKMELAGFTGDNVTDMFSKSDELKDYTKDNVAGRFTESGAFGDSDVINIFSNGELVLSGRKYSTPFGGKGLSSVSMFNYLNTVFKAQNATVYSSKEASSSFVTKAHKSVSLVGGGFNGFLYAMNAIAMFGCFSVIGIMYALTMMLGILSKTVKLIMAVPFAMLGSLKYIATVLVYTLIMIIEIVLTMFMYGLVVQLLSAIIQLLQGLVTAISGVSVLYALVHGSIVTSLLLGIIFLIFITALALKWRSSFIKGVNETVSKTIDKFFGLEQGEGNMAGANMGKPSFGQKALGGMAAGAGMFAGQKLMNRMGNKNASKGEASGTKDGESAGTGDGSEKDSDTNNQTSIDNKSENKDSNAIGDGKSNDEHKPEKESDAEQAVKFLTSPTASPTSVDVTASGTGKSDSETESKSDTASEETKTGGVTPAVADANNDGETTAVATDEPNISEDTKAVKVENSESSDSNESSSGADVSSSDDDTAKKDVKPADSSAGGTSVASGSSGTTSTSKADATSSNSESGKAKPAKDNAKKDVKADTSKPSTADGSAQPVTGSDDGKKGDVSVSGAPAAAKSGAGKKDGSGVREVKRRIQVGDNGKVTGITQTPVATGATSSAAAGASSEAADGAKPIATAPKQDVGPANDSTANAQGSSADISSQDVSDNKVSSGEQNATQTAAAPKGAKASRAQEQPVQNNTQAQAPQMTVGQMAKTAAMMGIVSAINEDAGAAMMSSVAMNMSGGEQNVSPQQQGETIKYIDEYVDSRGNVIPNPTAAMKASASNYQQKTSQKQSRGSASNKTPRNNPTKKLPNSTPQATQSGKQKAKRNKK